MSRTADRQNGGRHDAENGAWYRLAGLLVIASIGAYGIVYRFRTWRLGDPLSPIPFFLHFAVFGVLSGSLAQSWRHLWLAVIGVNVFYAIRDLNDAVHYKLKDYRYPLLTLWQALEGVMTERDTYVLLGVQLFATAGCAIVIFWLRQVLTKKTQ